MVHNLTTWALESCSSMSEEFWIFLKENSNLKITFHIIKKTLEQM